jgi:membrane protein YqaA with SNARE-associated domain
MFDSPGLRAIIPRELSKWEIASSREGGRDEIGVVMYIVVFLVVLGINLLPAFGPPTWSILVLYRLNSHLNTVPLVLIGAVAAAAGRYLLALGSRRLRNRFSEKRRNSLEAVRKRLEGGRGKSIAALGLFALSPIPSAQLFEGAGVTGLPLGRVVPAFFAGRLVSYSLYVAGAGAVGRSSVGETFRHSLTDWRGLAVQIVFLLAVVLLVRIDWSEKLGTNKDAAVSTS